MWLFCPIFFDLTHEHAGQLRTGKDRAHDFDTAGVVVGKRGIVKADDVGELLGRHC
jgi:hypothetical protein